MALGHKLIITRYNKATQGIKSHDLIHKKINGSGEEIKTYQNATNGNKTINDVQIISINVVL
ncbi:protein of unknown function [Serratia sp. Tan611]|nr:protein of unknown function [Serratia sp. Tan611]